MFHNVKLLSPLAFKGTTLTSKKAFKVWVLIVFVFLAILGTLQAWILWQIEGVTAMTIFSFTMEIITYFILTLVTTIFFIGAVCFAVFRDESSDLSLYELSREFEEKLDAKSEDIKNSTNTALTKLGLREFQLKESMKTLEQKLAESNDKLKETVESYEKILKTAQKKLGKIERKMSKIETGQKELPKLKKRLHALKTVRKDLQSLQKTVAKVNSVPEPYVTSTDEIKVLEGKMLKKGTVRRLKSRGIKTIEDLLLKNPVEIAMTKAMSESEAKSLQSAIQLLMIPGIQHEDAALLLKSGVNSKQELALQDAFNLGARVSKVAELYLEEGKIKEDEKPTLEEIASWIRLAKTQ